MTDELRKLPAAKKKGYGIYTASKTIHAPMWRDYRSLGVNIISTRIDEAGKGETKSFEDLWVRCVSEAASCAALVAYREHGETLKGGLVEIGAALANGRPVYFVGDTEGYSFLTHPLVTVVDDVSEAIRRAASMEESHD
jgi:hypothetical protein